MVELCLYGTWGLFFLKSIVILLQLYPPKIKFFENS